MTFADLKRFVDEQSARGLHGTTPVTVAGRYCDRIHLARGTTVEIDLHSGLIVVEEPLGRIPNRD